MKRREFIAAMGATVAWQPASRAQQPPASELAPQGKLRVGLLGYNPVLLTRKADGAIDGVSVRLGQFIAEKLGVAFEPVVYTTPQAGVDSYSTNQWEILIGPRSPATEQKMDFSSDFMLVDNLYIARQGVNFADATQVDRPGIRIGVAQNGVPDQFLTRSLKSAELVRVAAPVEIAVETLRSGSADVFASNGQIVYAVAAELPAAKVVPGTWLSVRMAIAIPKGKAPAAISKLSEIVDLAKSSGLVQKAIDDAGLKAVHVPPI